MNEKQLEQHIPVLGILHPLAGALFAVIGIFVFVFLSSIGAAAQDPDAFRPLFLGAPLWAFAVVILVPFIAGIGWGWQARHDRTVGHGPTQPYLGRRRSVPHA